MRKSREGEADIQTLRTRLSRVGKGEIIMIDFGCLDQIRQDAQDLQD
jgi:hypothetical protein